MSAGPGERVTGHPVLAELDRALAQGAAPEVWIRFPRQLGDVVMTLPFLRTLQHHWNAVAAARGVQLRWVAVGHHIGAALLSEADPAFIAASHIEGGGAAKPDPWALVRGWRKRPPAAFLNLSQSARLPFAAWLSRVPIRAGIADNHLRLLYHHPIKYRDLPLHIATRIQPLLATLTGDDRALWLPLTPDLLGGRKGPEKLREAGWEGEPYATLAFGTRGFGKRWFPEGRTWPELMRLLQARGLCPVLLGGPDEAPLGAELAAAVPGALNLAGRTTLPEACAIQSAAWGNVAIDTGLAHTAAATGRPTVTLFGPSPEVWVNPIGPRALALRGPDVDCDPGAVADFPTHGSSAHRISPARVMEVLTLLTKES
ncbi:ADP-heptose--LPS heptosyltransferase [Geothrix oryzae]|uniref:ADP-heptose--LPS heptosyltransferase n=1 Tax=Geothrix oryzae TaxID=2927975 RepID=A0ABM8DNF6_9BACT|nr:glycosyltransferase family 9 protein [Geothrix oryzae]BDU68431.1 ADP-heptose--LPS heptosyltransferase [Geothrix oryzae]